MKGDELAGPVYVDSSALLEIYIPESGSEAVESLLVGRTDILISELAITEVVSTLSRLRREARVTAERAGEVYAMLVADAEEGYYSRIPLAPATHRLAERLLLLSETVSLRSLDALHLALALTGQAGMILTFDHRLAEAAAIAGLRSHIPAV